MQKIVDIQDTLIVACPSCENLVEIDCPKASVPFMSKIKDLDVENSCFCNNCKTEFVARFRICASVSS